MTIKFTATLIVTSFLALPVHAQKKPLNTEPPVPHQTLPTETQTDPVEKPLVVEPPVDSSTRMARSLSQFTGNVHLSPFSSWLPMKYGLSLGYILDPNWTIEGEYTRRTISAGFQSVDFGEIKDHRYGIQSRWYPGSNSFNLILGLYKSEFTAELGDAVLNNVTGVPSTTVIKFESMGPQLGLANKWQWQSGITFGVDWFVMYIPAFNKKIDDNVLQSVNNSDDRSDLDKVISVVSNLPQFDILKINLGYSF